MEKTRVKKGERYWYLSELLTVESRYETNSIMDAELFKANNYFSANEYTPKMIAAMAEKICAVFNGASVIEMPNENEMLAAIPIIDDPCDYIGPGRRLGWSECYNWLKSKIVK